MLTHFAHQKKIKYISFKKMTIKLEEHDHEALSLHRHSVVLKNLHTENGMIQGYAGESAVISVMIASPLFTMALATVFTLIICFVIAWKVRLFVGYNFLPPFQYCQDVEDIGINRSYLQR